MKRTLSVLLALSSVALAPSRAPAQLLPGVTIDVEARPLVGVPVGDFGTAEDGIAATPGYGGAIGARVGLGPFAVYGDYQALRFGCDECAVAELDDRALDTGWEVGVELGVPFLPLVPVKPWVRGGVVGHQLGLSDDGASLTSDQSTGFAVSAGASVPLLLTGLRLAPRIGYTSYTADFHFEQLPDRGTTVTYVTAGLGLVYRF
jgi:hypothetical protein